MRVLLGEVVQFNPKPAKGSLHDASEVSFVPMAAVEAGSGRMDSSEVRTYGEVKKGFTHFAEGDVLFAKITPCMENGKSVVASELRNGVGYGSTEFHVLRPTSRIDARYLYQFVAGAAFRREAAHHMTGAVGQKRVPVDFLRSAEIPLPSLAEQQRVVAEIEKQFSRLDEAVATLQRVKANLKRQRNAVLQSVTSGELAAEGQTPPARDQWRWFAIEELASPEPRSVQSGPFGSNLKHSEFQAKGKLVIGIDNVRDGEFSMGSNHRISENKFAELAKYAARPGDVLITVMATIGRVCVVPLDLEPAIITKHGRPQVGSATPSPL